MKICWTIAVDWCRNKQLIIVAGVITVTLWGGYINKAYTAGSCQLQVARIVSMQGMIELRKAQEITWQPASRDTILCAGDMIRARSHSRAALRLSNDSMLRLDQKTSITFPDLPKENDSWLMDLFEGAIHIITRTPKPFKIRTPFVNASVEGTEFFVGLHEDSAKVVVYEGRVAVINDFGNIALNDHEAAITYNGQAPHKEIIVRPIDAVQWALYYPAILSYLRDNQLEDKSGMSALIRQASHLLTVGQADEASKAIQQVLQLEPNNSDGHALLAVIAVVQNEKNKALDLATKAVTLNPESVAAHLTLSYTQQAHFEIEAALESVQKALTLDPQNTLAWARSAELHMSLGDLDRALNAAQHAVRLDSSLAKTHTILGFAQLLQVEIETAKKTFIQAIALDQTDPMPRLGLGIALIREGDLDNGRIELEIAASLDPANSLIRSYLGKAYFEEKRYSLSSTQFDLAKERDPKDPTPWFYDAIQKQTQNRPIEALRDIQKSIELNNNRAVYRSKFLLDRDEAARGSSLARIFENLGFEKRAIMETAKSLSFDPANHSAHRFLSDIYANTPRHEAARVSELLQAQLLQPINVNPVQPHMAVADLNIITNTGPSSPGFNEFAPLMERSKPQLVASGIIGGNDTVGNELAFSKLYQSTSISLGQFHYESNGFRTNNNQNHDILNAFVQHALTSRLNIQAEIRTRSTDQGNLLLNFESDNTNPRAAQNRIHQKIHDNSVRIGAKYDLMPNQHIIFSGQFNDRKLQEINNPFPLTSPLINSKIESYQTEIQHQFRNHWVNVITGSGVFRTSFDQKTQQISAINNKTTSCCTHSDGNRDKTNGYIYVNLNFIPNINTTVGFSYDSYNETGLPSSDGFNPKFGFQWNIISNLRLRMAWFESIKSPLATNQTIEPTQVAGFNQLFDDINGTKSRRMGVGFDGHYQNKIFSGFEISKRDLSSPRFSGNGNFLDHDESLYYGYLYGILHKNWTARSEARFERFSRPLDKLQLIDTLSVPIGIDYFSENGIFANLTGTFVRQKVKREGNVENEGTEKYFLIDASLGYRLPNRRGILSLEARNLFDEHFLFQHINYSTSQAVDSRFVPTRTIFARVTFNF